MVKTQNKKVDGDDNGDGAGPGDGDGNHDDDGDDGDVDGDGEEEEEDDEEGGGRSEDGGWRMEMKDTDAADDNEDDEVIKELSIRVRPKKTATAMQVFVSQLPVATTICTSFSIAVALVTGARTNTATLTI